MIASRVSHRKYLNRYQPINPKYGRGPRDTPARNSMHRPRMLVPPERTVPVALERAALPDDAPQRGGDDDKRVDLRHKVDRPRFGMIRIQKSPIIDRIIMVGLARVLE